MRQRKTFLQGQEKSKTIKTGIKRKKLNKSEYIDRLSLKLIGTIFTSNAYFLIGEKTRKSGS